MFWASPCESYELWSTENTCHPSGFPFSDHSAKFQTLGGSVEALLLTDSSVLGGERKRPALARYSSKYRLRCETESGQVWNRVDSHSKEAHRESASTPVYCVVTGNHKGALLLVGWMPFFPCIYSSEGGVKKGSKGGTHHGIPTKVNLKNKATTEKLYQEKADDREKNSPKSARGKAPGTCFIVY